MEARLLQEDLPNEPRRSYVAASSVTAEGVRGRHSVGHYVVMSMGTPTSAATGVQMSTSSPGVSMETMRA